MKILQKSMSYAVLLCSCAKPTPATQTAVAALENSWDFEFTLLVETQIDEELLGGVTEQDLAAAWLVDAGAFELSWEGRVTEGPFRINRDGSESWRLLFEEVQNAEGEVQELQGRALESRRFPGGPLLSLQQSEWVSDFGALGDGIDPMIAMMFLPPPKKGKEGLLFTDFSWPYRIDGGRRSQQTVPLEWTEKDEDSEILSYEGPLSGKFQDRVWGVKGQFSGRLEGELQVSSEGEVEETRFLVERVVRVRSDDGHGVLRQRQVLSGSLRAGPGRMASPWPRTFYLTDSDVLGVLDSAKLDWESCAPQPDWNVDLNFEIDVAGKAHWTGDAEGFGECEEVLEALLFPPHHLPGLRVQSHLVIHQGVFQPYPNVKMPVSAKPPIHLVFGPDVGSRETVEYLNQLF